MFKSYQLMTQRNQDVEKIIYLNRLSPILIVLIILHNLFYLKVRLYPHFFISFSFSNLLKIFCRGYNLIESLKIEIV